MKNKKSFLLLFFVAFVSIALAACGKSNKPNTPDDPSGPVVDPTKPVYSINFQSFDYDTDDEDWHSIRICDPIALNAGMDITLPTPEREGYTFDGWYIDYKYSAQMYYSQMPAGNLNLYARWASPLDKIYTSPDGLPTNTGTRNSPLDVDTAARTIKAGGTLQFLNGEYFLNETIVLSADGSPTARTRYIGDTEEGGVKLNFSSMAENDANAGMKFVGDYNDVKNLHIYNAGDNGMLVGSSNNLIENCVLEKNRDTGLQISRYNGNAQPTIDTWPSNNIILNCTSFNNEDSRGEDADGFAAKLTVGENNIFDGCLSYWNIDDGWDLYAKVDSGEIGVVKILNCISYENGCTRRDDGTFYTPPSGADGNGFKLGGSGVPGQVIVDNCIAAYNYTMGFTDNSNPGIISITNCTSYNNGQKGNEAVKEYDNFNINRDGLKQNRNYYANLLSYYDDQYKDGFGSSNTRKTDEFNGSISNSIMYYNKNYYSISGPVMLQNDTSFTSSKYVQPYSYNSEGVFMASGDLSSFLEMGYNLHANVRNEDGSFNLGNQWKINTALLDTTKVDTNIGADLSKDSKSGYKHETLSTAVANETAIDVRIRECRDQLNLSVISSAIYTDIYLPKNVSGATVTWTSNNSLVTIDASGVKTYARLAQKISADTTVTLTATLTLEGKTLQKSFTVTIKKFDPRLGSISGIKDYTVLNTEDTPNYLDYKVFDYTTTSLVLTNGTDYNSTITITYTNLSGETTTVDTVGKEVGTYVVSYKFQIAGDNEYKTATSTITVRDSEDAIEVTSAKSRLGFIIDDQIELTTTVTYNTGTMYIVAVDNTTNAPTAQTIKDAYTNKTSFTGLVSEIKCVPVTQLTFSTTLSLNSNYTQDTSVQVYIVVDHPENGLGKVYLLSNVEPTESIATPQALYNALMVAGNSKKAYKLTADIDMNGATWVQNDTDGVTFQGYFDGKFHKVSNLNINIYAAKEGGGGLFFKADNAIIKNLALENIKADAVTGNASPTGKVAALVGLVKGTTTITNISVHNCFVNGAERTAGVVGQYSGNGDVGNGVLTISKVSVTSDMLNRNYQIMSQYNTNEGGKYVGGVIAHAQYNSPNTLIVEDCYVATWIVANNQFAGGIVGRIDPRWDNSTVTINRCFFAGSIQNSNSYIGGIIAGRQSGDLIITNCVSFPESLNGSSGGSILSTQMCVKLGVAPDFYYVMNDAIICENVYGLVPDPKPDDEPVDPDDVVVRPVYNGEARFVSEFKVNAGWQELGFDMENVWVLDTTSRIVLKLRCFQ